MSDQFDRIPESLAASRLLVDTFDATSAQDFRRRVLDRGYSPLSVILWESPGILVPSCAAVYEPDGTLWLLGAGVEDYGRFLASFFFSDMVFIPPYFWGTHPLMNSLRLRMLALFNSAVGGTRPTRTIVAGHSMGGAAAELVAVELRKLGLVDAGPLCITTGAPKPGNQRFRDDASASDVIFVRWQNAYDPIPLIPPSQGLFAYLFTGPLSRPLASGVFDYRQIGGGRVFALLGDSWYSADVDAGILNVWTIVTWAFRGQWNFEEQHSLLNYLAYFEGVAASFPSFPSRDNSGTPDMGRNSMATPVNGPMFLVRIFGKAGTQGWSNNFYTLPGSYDLALAKGAEVADAMIGMMSNNAALYAITASLTDVIGDSKPSNYNKSGAIDSAALAELPPNLAQEFRFTTDRKNRRQWWIHGLRGTIQKDTDAGTVWVAKGTLGTARDAFISAAISGPNGGFVNTGVGFYNRVLNRDGANNLGLVNSIATNNDSRVSIFTVAPHGIPNPLPAEGVTVQLKGRAPLFGLPRILKVYASVPPLELRCFAQLPLGFVFVKGLTLWNQKYRYIQPNAVESANINTHKTGVIFVHLRGRRSVRR